MLTKILSLSAAAALAFGAHAMAAEPGAPTRTLSAASVNFGDRAEAAGFYQRLKLASAEVCDTNSANPRIGQADQVCAARVLAKTVYAMNQPTLTAMLQADSGARRFATR